MVGLSVALARVEVKCLYRILGADVPRVAFCRLGASYHREVKGLKAVGSSICM